MRILLTGGAGFIGSHFARAALAAGHSLRVLDNLSTGRRENLAGLEIDFVEGDIRDQAAVRRAAQGMTHAVHLAAMVSVPGSVADPLAANAVNVTGALNLLLAAREHGLRRVGLASSSAVYGAAADMPLREDVPLRPLSPYGAGKLAGELYAYNFHLLYGLETVALRFFNVYGPRQDPASEYAAVIPKFLAAARAGREPVIYGDGGQTRDFIYAGDVARACLLALTAPEASGQAVNIAGGRAISLLDLVQAVSGVAGRRLHPEHAAPRPGDIRHSLADTTRAKDILGFTPEVSLEQGLRLTWEAMREE